MNKELSLTRALRSLFLSLQIAAVKQKAHKVWKTSTVSILPFSRLKNLVSVLPEMNQCAQRKR